MSAVPLGLSVCPPLHECTLVVLLETQLLLDGLQVLHEQHAALVLHNLGLDLMGAKVKAAGKDVRNQMKTLVQCVSIVVVFSKKWHRHTCTTSFAPRGLLLAASY